MIKTYGPALIDKGYSLCAILPNQKAAYEKGWPEHPLTKEDCAAPRYSDDHGIGFICGRGERPLFGIDVDVMDPNLAEDIRGAIGDIIAAPHVYRQGQPPKFLIPVRMKGAKLRHIKLHREKDGAEAGLDLLGKGAQFVAMGNHPSGHPYVWREEHGDLITEPPAYDELPELTEDQLQGICEIFNILAEGAGFYPLQTGSAVRASEDALARLLDPGYPKLPMTLSQAERYIRESGIDGSTRDPWLWVGMALNHQFGGTEDEQDAMLLWDRWSSEYAGYQGLSDIEKNWASFDPKKRGAKTMRWVVAAYRAKKNPAACRLTEAGRVARFLELYGQKYRFAVDTKQWYEWSGIHWWPVNELELCEDCEYVNDELLLEDIAFGLPDANADPEAFKAARKAGEAFYAKMNLLQAKIRFRKYLVEVYELQCHSKMFDADIRYFGVANGDLDMETGKLLPPDQKRYTAIHTAASFDPNATCPVWDKTVREIFSDNAEMIRFFQRCCGMALRGRQEQEFAVMIYGDGANGKTTLLTGLKEVFGDYAAKLSSSAILTKGRALARSSSAASPEIAQLRGKRLVTIEESSRSARLDAERFKELASNGDVSSRGLYEAQRTIPVTWTMFFATNYLPDVAEQDYGTWRRIAPIPLRREFSPEERDMFLADKLRAERDGILQWCLRGLEDYLNDTEWVAPEVRSAVKKYREEQDLTKAFLASECVYDPTDERIAISVTDLFFAYRSWYSSYYTDRDYGSGKLLAKEVGRVLGAKKVRRRICGKNLSTCFIGLRLRDTSDDFAESAPVEDTPSLF